MTKLLTAGFTRLKKDYLFYLVLLFTLGLACFMIYTQYLDLKRYHEVIELDQLLMNNITIIGIVIAVFTSLFVGREYSDGTLRNKIIIGSSRTNIYLSNLLLVIGVSVLVEILHLIIISLLGIPIFGTLKMTLSSFSLIVFCILVMILAFCSIFTFIAMVVSNKTISAITSILFAFFMMMVSITLLTRIEAPEYIESAQMTNAETKKFEIMKEKNPRYLTKKQRKDYQQILNFIPSGQAFVIVGRMDTNYSLLPWYSFAVILLFTGSGIFLFQKKELK